MNTTRSLRMLTLAIGASVAAASAAAAPGDQPVAPLPAAKAKPKAGDPRTRSAELPARGLFAGDQLSDGAKAQLSALVVQAQDLRVEVALVVPEGPWKIDGSGAHERDLTPARLAALRRFLTERGVDPKRIFVESHVDAKLKEPRLQVQMVGTPTQD